MAFKFLKTGAESAKIAQQAAAEAEQRKEQQGKHFRYWLKENEEAKITFVDGDLSPEGFLWPPRYYEHNLYLNGQWNNYFVCPEKTNPDAKDPCPICESGDRPSLVALFTVIDHRIYTVTKGVNAGKVYKDTVRLLVAKSQTFEYLNKIALKRGGLAGILFDVSRVGDKAASVGSMFDFVEKKPIEELKKLYTYEKVDTKTNQKSIVTAFTPIDYEKEIVYRSGDDLRKLGLSKPTGSVSPTPSTVTQPAAEEVDYSNQL